MNEVEELIGIWEESVKDRQEALARAKQDMVELIRWDKICTRKLIEAEQTLAYLTRQKKLDEHQNVH